MSKSTTIFKDIKNLTPKQSLSIAILVVVAVVVIWIFWEKISNGIANYIARHKQQQQDIVNYGSTTVTTDFDTLAVQIYNAMKGWGTDEAAIERVLSQIHSNADWAALRRAYIKVNKDGTYTTLDSRIAFEGTDRELARWRAILDENGVTIYSF